MTRTRRTGVVLVVVGLLLFAAPFVLWPHYGEMPHSLYVTETDDPEGTVTDYEHLSPEEQEIFDAQFTDESATLYSESDAALISTFEAIDYGRYEEQVYRVTVEHADGAWLFVTPVRWSMFGLGTLLLLAGFGRALNRQPDADSRG